jgi:16S rRNA (guanine966-N2)-methyltransferase
MIKIIAGSAKGHNIKTLKGTETRPTTNRVKESLFNILAPHIAESKVLDLFSGSGSLGIEALSRGAEHAVLVDNNRASMAIISENLQHTKLADKARVLNLDYIRALQLLKKEGAKFDIIFLDPPYNKNFIQNTLKNLIDNDIISKNGILVAEHNLKDILPEKEGKLKMIRSEKKYGDTVLSFYRPED